MPDQNFTSRVPAEYIPLDVLDSDDTEQFVVSNVDLHENHSKSDKAKDRRNLIFKLLLWLTLLLVFAWFLRTTLPYLHFFPRFQVLIGGILYGFPNPNAQSCTMDTCFDRSKCGANASSFKFYIYPELEKSERFKVLSDVNAKQINDDYWIYNDIDSYLRSHPDRTLNPEEACLFFPNFDMLAEGGLSHVDTNWWITRELRRLPHWNGGKNHVVFEINDRDEMEYAADAAISIKSSWNRDVMRSDFDLSFLLPNITNVCPEHLTKNRRRDDLLARPYFMTWKGSFTCNFRHRFYRAMNQVHTVRNKTVTVKHRSDTLHDYCHLHEASIFGGNPRGNGLHAFRLHEILKAGEIPVTLADKYVFPFEEVLDWRTFSVIIPEVDVNETLSILSSLTDEQLVQLRDKGRAVYERHLETIPKQLEFILDIIKARIYQNHSSLKEHYLEPFVHVQKGKK